MLKHAPARIVTQKNVDDRTASGVVIPAPLDSYVKAYLEKKDDNENVTSVKVITIPEEVQNIDIADLTELFSLNAINLLNKYNIYTLSKLIAIVDNSTLLREYFYNTKHYNEMINITRILKCK